MDTLKWHNDALNDDLVPKRTASSFTVPDNHEELLFMAKLAEQVERYDEMVLCMRKIVKMNPDLSQDERNLLSVAYKNVIGGRRTSWRLVSSLEARDQDAAKTENLPLMAMMRKQYEAELEAVCQDILNLLDNFLIRASPAGETMVFYLKMKGDYHRYYAEIAPGDQQKHNALDAYEKADKAATETLPATHPVRLGLALNLSVFHYEIMKQQDTGYQLARRAYDEAIVDIDNMETEQYRESALIISLLQDNLNLWTQDQA